MNCSTGEFKSMILPKVIYLGTGTKTKSSPISSLVKVFLNLVKIKVSSIKPGKMEYPFSWLGVIIALYSSIAPGKVTLLSEKA